VREKAKASRISLTIHREEGDYCQEFALVLDSGRMRYITIDNSDFYYLGAICDNETRLFYIVGGSEEIDLDPENGCPEVVAAVNDEEPPVPIDYFSCLVSSEEDNRYQGLYESLNEVLDTNQYEMFNISITGGEVPQCY